VSKHFGQQARSEVAEMVEDLRASMSEIIAEEKWMQKSTKASAIRKLKKTRKVIAAVEDAIDVKRLDQRYESVRFDFPRDSYRQMATKGLIFWLY
jgi:predicted metalloendopeptidase